MYLDKIELGGEINLQLDREYVVKGWMDRDTVSVVYGEPNTGKSFWAVDLAHHVHNGIAWNGCRVKQGNVLYIAAEGGAMFANRLVARGARFYVLRDSVTLARPPGQNDGGNGGDLGRALAHIGENIGTDFVLIIVDTLARAMGGGDENTAPDIAALMRGVDALRQHTRAHVMLVHHSGKDAAKGARGHSSLRGAIDTEISIERDKEHDDVFIARTTKQRDMPGGAEDRFTRLTVELGRDSDGDPVTSCIINHVGGRA